MSIILETRPARKPQEHKPLVLTPYRREESIPVKQAAKIAGVHPASIRNWASTKDIGRRVAGGPWQVSWPALLMLLDDDNAALQSYLDGDRSSPLVRPYFERCGLDPQALFGVRA